MHSERQFLRGLLSALIAERQDAQLLYIPRGEEGQRRMIRALLDMRIPRDSDPLAADIDRFMHLPSQPERIADKRAAQK